MRLSNLYSFVWLISLTGLLTALTLWAVSQKKEVKNWIEEPSDELMDFK